MNYTSKYNKWFSMINIYSSLDHCNLKFGQVTFFYRIVNIIHLNLNLNFIYIFINAI